MQADHIIQKQLFDIHITKMEESQEVHDLVYKMAQHELKKQQEIIFNQLAPEEMNLTIDRIEIDLSFISIRQLERELGERYSAELTKKLEALNFSELAKHPNQNIGFENNYSHVLQIFIFFLINGFFPWRSSYKDFEAFENDLITALPNIKRTIRIKQAVLPKFTDSNVQKRLRYQFSSSFIRIFCQIYLPGFYQFLTSLEKEGNQLFDHHPSGFESDLFSRSFLMWIHSPDYQFFQDEMKHFLDIDIIDLFNSAEIEMAFNRCFYRRFPSASNFASSPKTAKFDEKPEKERVENSIRYYQEAEKVDRRNSETDQVIYIGNAGLVILNPFVEQYFKICGIVEDKKLIDAEKACYLIQYLVTGYENFSERDLPLNKIFCNLPMDYALSPLWKFDQYELQQAEEILNSLLAYWTVLKNTSINGLRANFLQREGRISLKAENWHLMVEQKSYDLLLEQIPWSFSIIKFPWMDRELYVEWI